MMSGSLLLHLEFLQRPCDHGFLSKLFNQGDRAYQTLWNSLSWQRNQDLAHIICAELYFAGVETPLGPNKLDQFQALGSIPAGVPDIIQQIQNIQIRVTDRTRLPQWWKGFAAYRACLGEQRMGRGPACPSRLRLQLSFSLVGNYPGHYKWRLHCTTPYMFIFCRSCIYLECTLVLDLAVLQLNCSVPRVSEQEEISKAKALYKAAVESNKNGYGFMNQYIDVFKGQDKLLNECCTVNPFEVEINQRMRVKFVNEEEEFDPERYAFDNYDDEQLQEIEPILSLKAPLTQGLEQQFEAMSIQQEPQPVQDTVLNHQLLIQILDVLYAYHYELRMHSFRPDPHSESASNIIKLSSVLSSFVDYHELTHPPQLLLALLVNCTRRALLKPLYRNFELSQKVFDDMVEMTLNAQQPRKVMVQRLQQVREIMEGGEHRLYNVCYIDDMIQWVQGNCYTDGEIRLVSQQLMDARGKVSKKQIGYELEEVDMMAQEYKKSRGME